MERPENPVRSDIYELRQKVRFIRLATTKDTLEQTLELLAEFEEELTRILKKCD